MGRVVKEPWLNLPVHFDASIIVLCLIHHSSPVVQRTIPFEVRMITFPPGILFVTIQSRVITHHSDSFQAFHAFQFTFSVFGELA